MTELYAKDFLWDPKRRMFRALKRELAHPMAKPIGEELLLRDCWGVDKQFKLLKAHRGVSRYVEVGADLERPLKVVVVE